MISLKKVQYNKWHHGRKNRNTYKVAETGKNS